MRNVATVTLIRYWVRLLWRWHLCRKQKHKRLVRLRVCAFLIAHPPSAVCHPTSAICHPTPLPQSDICHLPSDIPPSAIRHLPSADIRSSDICHLPSAICHLPAPPSATRHLPSDICHLTSDIPEHLPSAICRHLPYAIRCPTSAICRLPLRAIASAGALRPDRLRHRAR